MEQEKAAGPLKRYRKAKRIRADLLAKALGVDKSTLWRIDNRQQWPSREFCERVAKLTDGAVTPNDFLAIEPATSATEAA